MTKRNQEFVLIALIVALFAYGVVNTMETLSKTNSSIIQSIK